MFYLSDGYDLFENYVLNTSSTYLHFEIVSMDLCTNSLYNCSLIRSHFLAHLPWKVLFRPSVLLGLRHNSTLFNISLQHALFKLLEVTITSGMTIVGHRYQDVITIIIIGFCAIPFPYSLRKRICLKKYNYYNST